MTLDLEPLDLPGRDSSIMGLIVDTETTHEHAYPTAPAFVAMAHRIVWATVATVDRHRPSTIAHPPPHLAMGRRTIGRLDRYQPDADQTRPSGSRTLCFRHLLGLNARHLHGRMSRCMGLRRRDANRGLGPVRQRTGAGRLRSPHRPGLDKPHGRRVCRPAAGPVALARLSGQCAHGARR